MGFANVVAVRLAERLRSPPTPPHWPGHTEGSKEVLLPAEQPLRVGHGGADERLQGGVERPQEPGYQLAPVSAPALNG